MFEYFYNEIMRKTIIGFGTLFNDIVIQKKNDSGETFSEIKVPLAYGPKQKFLARLEESPELNRPFQMTLPRMSFEFVNLAYDPSRKTSATQTFLAGQSATPSNIVKTYMPVPYNMDFELSIMTKLNDDMLQIVEQILPYFQPSYNISVDLVDTIGEKRDIPIVFNNIVMEDNYDGDFNSRRYLVYTLSFTAKTYLFGPTSSVSKDIIKRISVSYSAGDSNSTSRDVTYSVQPVATKNYTNNVVATINEDITSESDSVEVSNAQNIPIGSYITISNETLKVTSKNQNILFVQRGAYSTRAADHVSGSEVKLITEQDNDLIAYGDDFGFN